MARCKYHIQLDPLGLDAINLARTLSGAWEISCSVEHVYEMDYTLNCSREIPEENVRVLEIVGVRILSVEKTEPASTRRL